MATDDAGAILAQVRRWARAQGGLRAGLAATALTLVATAAGRPFGVSLPAGVWLGVPGLALVGWAWPLDPDRLLLRAGRRLGVGERIAAVDVLTRRGARALLDPLLGEIAALRRRMWRLVLGPMEIGTAAVALGLALAVGAVPLPSRSPVGRENPPPGTLMETAAPAEPRPAEPRPEPAAAVPRYPTHADAPTYSPYQDLLAAVLGLEGDLAAGLRGEALTARLAQEEGLLRALAERLAQAAAGGLSPSQRAELLPLAQEVARADLRERLGRLLDRGDEPAAREAREAVTAVLEALERTGEDAGGGPEGSPDKGGSATSRHPVQGEGTAQPEPNGLNGHDPLDAEGDDLGIAGTAAGDPLEPGPAEEWGPTREGQPHVAQGTGEGPMRAYLVLGVPGEAPGAGGTPTALSPQEVEVVLRARGVPAELRDLVRRYFELITGGSP